MYQLTAVGEAALQRWPEMLQQAAVDEVASVAA
jgi:hypothetical protein